MTTRTRIRIEDDQYEQLAAIKDRHDTTWRGLLYLGAQRLEAGRTPFLDHQEHDQ